MNYYKLSLSREGINILYPVSTESISGSKYRKDMRECVCVSDELLEGDGITGITKDEYDTYGACRLVVTKNVLIADGIDTLTVAVQLPEGILGEEVELYINDELQDFAVTDGKSASFQIVADASLQGEILRIQAESTNWNKSNRVLVEVI